MKEITERLAQGIQKAQAIEDVYKNYKTAKILNTIAVQLIRLGHPKKASEIREGIKPISGKKDATTDSKAWINQV